MLIEGSLARRLGQLVLALSLGALACGGGDSKTTEGVEGLAGPEPFLRFVKPTGGQTLTGLAPVQFELQFPAGPPDSATANGLPPARPFLALGIDGQPPVPMTESPGVLQLKTYNFDNGPHTLLGVLSDAKGRTWQDTVEVVFDNPTHQLRGYEPAKPEYRDGEEVVLQVDFGEPRLSLTADFAELDRFYPRGAERITDLGAGRYEIRYTISASNSLADGIHSVWVDAKNAAGRSVRHGLPLRLRNAPLPPVVVEGGFYVDEPPPALVTPSQPSAALTTVNAPPVILTGGVAEFNVSWTQPPSAPAQKLLLRAAGFSGYFVVPLPDTAGAPQGQATIRVYLPASAPGAFNDGPLDFIISIVDTIGQVVDTVTETVLQIAVGSGGVQVALTWDTDADVDIAVTDPAGNLIDFENPTVGVGALDLDSNAMCVIDGVRAENIAWEPAQEPPGIYQIRVNLYQACGQASANWHIIATYCGRTEEYNGVLTAADADESGVGRAVASFTVDCDQRVSGRVTYDKRNTILPAGSTPATVETAVPFAPVRVISTGGTTLAEGVTDLDGRYAFAFSNLDEDNYRVEVEASYVETASGDVVARVAKIDEGVAYRFKSPDIMGAGSMVQTQDFHFKVEDGAGAFNVLAVVRIGYDWVKKNGRPEDTEGLTQIKANWSLGEATPKGAVCQADGSGCPFSFQNGEEIWINGTDDAQDEWDETVIAHEYSHFIIRKLVLSNLPGGPHGAVRSSPALSWSEGLATALGQRQLGRPLYVSENKLGSFTVDIEDGTQDINPGSPGEFFNTTDGTATGDVIEWLDSMIVWDLMDATNETHDRIDKEPFALNVMFDPPPGGSFVDRAGNGVDLVDYLDHFRSGSVNRFDQELMCLTLERLFPYDGFGSAATCP